MSVTFYPSFYAAELGRYVPVWRCNCGEDLPPMADGQEVSATTCYVCENLNLNLNNVNARDLLDYLELSVNDDLVGQVKAIDLYARCQRRLWPEEHNMDPAISPEQMVVRVGLDMADVLNRPVGSAKVHVTGRPHCYLREQSLTLLGIIRRSLTETNFHRDHVFISWS